MRMRWLLLAVFLVPGLPYPVAAQNAIRIPNCGDARPPAGSSSVYMDSNGNLCTNASSGGGGGLAGITITNKSGTIAAGGATNQIAIAANTARVTCHVQPQTTDIFIAPATTAPLSASSEYATVLTEYTCPAGYKGAVAVSGLTTGASYYADEGTVP